MHQQKIIVIAGPTATGKSDLGVFLARKINGEIISADSRQVYTGMDIGTGKISKRKMRGIKHYLLNVANPKQAGLNIVKFKRLAEKAIKAIITKGKTPIIVGGTGFWIDALVQNQNFPDVKPDPVLRKKLASYSAQGLLAILQKLDPLKAKNIDWKNKRRVIRAIEIAQAAKNTTPAQTNAQNYKVLYLGLDMPMPKLEKAIAKRLDLRLKSGMINEVRHLHHQGLSWKILENFGLEYRFIAQYLQNKFLDLKQKPDRQKMRQALYFAVRQYAKRQRTWFKRNKEIIWLAADKKATARRAVALTEKFLKN